MPGGGQIVAQAGSCRLPPIEIEVDEVRFSYGRVVAIEGVDLRCRTGQVLGVVGPSGCGKSTLLALLAGLLEPDAGRIEVAARSDPAGRLASCAHMPQRDLLLPWYSAIDNAALALRNLGVPAERAREQARVPFRRLGLGGFEHSRPEELSGGMRQRVAFVRTLMAGKPVLLLDEPFAGLDAITRAEIQTWLAMALSAEPRTVVMVTHDVEEALYLCDEVAVLSPRPARVLGRLEPPRPRDPDRPATVADPALVKLRRRAMTMLAAGESVRSDPEPL